MVETNFVIVSFASLIAVLDPLGMVPVYLALFSREERKHTVVLAMTTAATVLVTLTLFMLSGMAILTYLGISLPAFRVAGGIIIFMMALDMLHGSMSSFKRAEGKEDYSDLRSYAIVPLAIPLLSGPGAMSAVILFSNRAEDFPHRVALFFVIVACSAIIYLVIRLAEKVDRLLGRTGIRIATRIMGLLLLAVALQFIADGLGELFPGLVEKTLAQ